MSVRCLITGTAWLACLLSAPQLTSDAAGQKLQRERLQHPSPAHATAHTTTRQIPEAVRLRIIRAEDERRWDSDLASLLSNKDARIRHQATLAAGRIAAGRIGDERAVAQLASLLGTDTDAGVRAMAAFALGETESVTGADALLEALRTSKDEEVRARAIEALGKIAAALPKEAETRKTAIGQSILDVLNAEWKRREESAHQTALLSLTAALRARPVGASKVVARFLDSPDARVRADAANVLARLRAKDATAQLRSTLNDQDAVVRANAARALGAAEDNASLDALVTRGTSDPDQRVRTSAIGALASLKDRRAAGALLRRAETLYAGYLQQRTAGRAHPHGATELFEIAAALGSVLTGTNDQSAVRWLQKLRQAENMTAPEVEVALARVAPAEYVAEQSPRGMALLSRSMHSATAQHWQRVAALGQGLREIARLTSTPPETGANAAPGLTKEIIAASVQTTALNRARSLLDDPDTPALALPDVLRAFAAFKPSDLGAVLRANLTKPDVVVRGSAAALLNGLPPDEQTTSALVTALPVAMRDQMNDAALAILDALAIQKSPPAFEAVKTALASSDYLVRRRAVFLLKEGGAGDYRERVGTVATRWQASDYRRALARQDKQVRAVVVTDKGRVVIELLPAAAPLTVHNFIELARRGFFARIAFHRVVPNFVIQGGDPRGDGEGGPGYQIRCEINEVPYDRGAVGMALSGKDTGGSQWFVTHAPQPHLDGGYTVFGRVVSGMETIDWIARGDRIRRISVTEGKRSGTPNR